LRMGEHLGPERVRLGVRLVGKPPQRVTPARRRLIELLSDGLLHGKSDAARKPESASASSMVSSTKVRW